MSTPVRFEAVARLPVSDDNCAIALRDLEAGTSLQIGSTVVSTDFPILEGHRLAATPIAKDRPLLSWGLPFGRALRDIGAGAYLCNAGMLAELRLRGLHPLPPSPNFGDLPLSAFDLDERTFRPGRQVEAERSGTFQGFERAGGRGVGTRSKIVILSTSSRAAAVARQIAQQLSGLAEGVKGVDGVVAVAHTEGGAEHRPNNENVVLRALAGFMVHPNVGAVVALDSGTEPINNALLHDFMRRHDYPLAAVPHCFLSLDSGLSATLRQAEKSIRAWLALLEKEVRSPQPISRLKLALQCGGSDAFSGISGNPLAARVARQVVAQGGFANLAETDELIGAESYLLANVRDLQTARGVIERIERFKRRVAWHGSSAEGNPSGGNRYRGLYNITLKSIGAALKRHPEVRLDHVIDYAEPMREPGFYFMDSPGNDLESVAGQVASGCNLIFFTTGNGSITNFPFVPTLKFMNTTRRYQLLSREMDINAGAFLDGAEMGELTRETLEKSLSVASGEPSCGERAGHSQVSIWRDWRQTRRRPPRDIPSGATYSGLPLVATRTRTEGPRPCSKSPSESVGLILPTSLCSGQVAQMIARRLNRQAEGGLGISRYAALVHTEGCGVSAGITEELYSRTLIGYLRHPNTALALLLEHGCEKTHNAYFQQKLAEAGHDPGRFGFASIQLDGGIERVTRKVEDWFREKKARMPRAADEPIGLDRLSIGLATPGEVDRRGGRFLASWIRRLVEHGATVVMAEEGRLDPSSGLDEWTKTPFRPTLGYGEAAATAGLHVMETPTSDWGEILTGLAATGVHVLLVRCPRHPLAANPLVATLQYAPFGNPSGDHDLVLDEAARDAGDRLIDLILKTGSRQYVPRSHQLGLVGFQITRGRWGVSL